MRKVESSFFGHDIQSLNNFGKERASMHALHLPLGAAIRVFEDEVGQIVADDIPGVRA